MLAACCSTKEQYYPVTVIDQFITSPASNLLELFPEKMTFLGLAYLQVCCLSPKMLLPSILLERAICLHRAGHWGIHRQLLPVQTKESSLILGQDKWERLWESLMWKKLGPLGICHWSAHEVTQKNQKEATDQDVFSPSDTLPLWTCTVISAPFY